MLKIRPQTNVPPGKMELKNSRSSGRAGLEPSELKSRLKVELDALSQNMLKIRPQTKCFPRKNGIKKFPEFWPSRAGTERTQVKTKSRTGCALSEYVKNSAPNEMFPPEKWN